MIVGFLGVEFSFLGESCCGIAFWFLLVLFPLLLKNWLWTIDYLHATNECDNRGFELAQKQSLLLRDKPAYINSYY